MTTTAGDREATTPAPGGIPRRRALAIAVGATVGGALFARPSSAQSPGNLLGESGAAHGGPDVAGEWFEQVAATAAAAPFPTFGGRVWAISWLSALDALGARIEGSFSPNQRQRFENAAVATAVHDALVELVPSQAGALDAALAASLATVPEGRAKQDGISAGQAAAAATLTERDGDGLDLVSINPPFTPPPEAPGVYRLPPGATQTEGAAWGQARPFLLDTANQFRPGPPVALGTDAYRAELEEVRRLGGTTSTDRTDEQADTALLWAQSPLAAYIPALRALLGNRRGSLARKVGLLAAFTATTLDTLTAVAEAKFTYLFWRPVTAIRAADDPTWTSFVTTPASPEYPSGHAAYSGAAEQVLEHFAGRRSPVPFTMGATQPNGEVVSRDHPRGTRWSGLTQESIDGRVWAGAHFRSSDDVGADLGRRVADYGLGQLGPRLEPR